MPLILTLHNRLAADLLQVRQELAALSQRVNDIDVRLARIEGAVLGPWRPDETEKPS